MSNCVSKLLYLELDRIDKINVDNVDNAISIDKEYQKMILENTKDDYDSYK